MTRWNITNETNLSMKAICDLVQTAISLNRNNVIIEGGEKILIVWKLTKVGYSIRAMNIVNVKKYLPSSYIVKNEKKEL